MSDLPRFDLITYFSATNISTRVHKHKWHNIILFLIHVPNVTNTVSAGLPHACIGYLTSNNSLIIEKHTCMPRYSIISSASLCMASVQPTQHPVTKMLFWSTGTVQFIKPICPPIKHPTLTVSCYIRKDGFPPNTLTMDTGRSQWKPETNLHQLCNAGLWWKHQQLAIDRYCCGMFCQQKSSRSKTAAMNLIDGCKGRSPCVIGYSLPCFDHLAR